MTNKLGKTERRWLLTFLVATIAFNVWGCSSAAVGSSSTPKMVFAHYMVCCPRAGGNASIDDYKAEIREAQLKGIDGFALNNGGWSNTEPEYKQRTIKIFTAAQSLGTGFKLFISADGAAQAEIEDMIDAFRDHPNQLRINGKPVLSTFSGEGRQGELGNSLVARAHAKGALMVPYFFPRPVAEERPDMASARSVADRYKQADGFFYFGAAGTGDQLAEANRLIANEWLSRGKLYMASVTPFYLGGSRNYRIFETEGFKSMAQEWEAAISVGATWIQIVTWNDWGESTYVAPIPPCKPNTGPRELPNSAMPSHAGYLDASQYYISWFKMGKRPAIKRDALFYFHRLQSKSVNFDSTQEKITSRVDAPAGIDRVRDSLFLTLFLKEPASLIVESGPTITKMQVPAGISHLEIPFRLGKQHFVLMRKQVVVIDKIGEAEILGSNAADAYNYFSGSAASQLSGESSGAFWQAAPKSNAALIMRKQDCSVVNNP